MNQEQAEEKEAYPTATDQGTPTGVPVNWSFHEHTSVLVASLTDAYVAAGRALTSSDRDDDETDLELGRMMVLLSHLHEQAKRLREKGMEKSNEQFIRTSHDH